MKLKMLVRTATLAHPAATPKCQESWIGAAEMARRTRHDDPAPRARFIGEVAAAGYHEIRGDRFLLGSNRPMSVEADGLRRRLWGERRGDLGCFPGRGRPPC